MMLTVGAGSDVSYGPNETKGIARRSAITENFTLL